MLFLTGDVVYSRDFSAGAYARAAESEEITWILRAGDVRLGGLDPFCAAFRFLPNESCWERDEAPSRIISPTFFDG